MLGTCSGQAESLCGHKSKLSLRLGVGYRVWHTEALSVAEVQHSVGTFEAPRTSGEGVREVSLCRQRAGGGPSASEASVLSVKPVFLLGVPVRPSPGLASWRAQRGEAWGEGSPLLREGEPVFLQTWDRGGQKGSVPPPR
jgi:hypothetical protein